MTNWTSLVAKLDKAEADAQTWRDGLADAEKTLTAAKAELSAALGPGVKKTSNGTAHKPIAARIPRVRVVRSRRTPMVKGRKDQIMALVRERGGFVTINDVLHSQKCKRPYVHALLHDLVTDGRLRRIATGRYALPEKAVQS